MIYELPLSSTPQRFQTAIAGTTYTIEQQYRDAEQGGWFVNIYRQDVALISGLPLVTGLDLLAPYAHLAIGAQLFVQTDGDPMAPPTEANLGVESHVYAVTP